MVAQQNGGMYTHFCVWRTGYFRFKQIHKALFLYPEPSCLSKRSDRQRCNSHLKEGFLDEKERPRAAGPGLDSVLEHVHAVLGAVQQRLQHDSRERAGTNEIGAGQHEKCGEARD